MLVGWESKERGGKDRGRSLLSVGPQAKEKENRGGLKIRPVFILREVEKEESTEEAGLINCCEHSTRKEQET